MIKHDEPQEQSVNFNTLGRIFSYARPHSLLIFLSVFFVLLTTGGQLLIPVLIQQTVDNNLRPSWVRGEIGLHEEVLQWDSRIEGREIAVSAFFYYPEALAGPFFRARTDNLQLYFLIPRDNTHDPILLKYDAILEASDRHIAVSEENYQQLTIEDKQILRIQDWNAVQRKALFYLGLLFAVLFFSFMQVYLISVAGQRIMKDLRLNLYSHTSRQSLQFLQKQQVGRLVTRVSNDVETINDLFTNVISAIVADVVMMIGVFVTLFLMNVRLALISLVILPPVALLLVVFQRKARKAYHRVRFFVSAVNAYLSEHFSGVKIVQAFVREKAVIKAFSEENHKLFKANLRELHVFAVFRPLVDLLAISSISFIIYFSASSFLQGFVSLGILIAFITLIQRFYQPVQDMAEKFTLVQSAMVGCERVFSLLDEDELEPRGEGNLPEHKKIKGNLEIRDLHFSYVPGEPVLRGISLSSAPGERIALVGHTGSGKSTIANILTRLWEFDSGSVHIDGIDIKTIPPEHLRGFVQLIQQDISLFHLSVRDNLLLGKEMDDEQIFAILNEVEAGDFIRALPEGLDTMVTEDASNFSVGQLQLLSFARLLIQDPRIVIMDEATASIDTKTEKKVQQAIDRILEGRTSIVIAHRLSTIKEADSILVLNKGKIAESGSHDELMQARGIYYTLQEVQNQRYQA